MNFWFEIGAALDESIIRGYAVKRERGARQGITVLELPARPKAGTVPFSGSELSFRLTDDGKLLPLCLCSSRLSDNI